MGYTKEQLFNLPVTRLVDIILEYQKLDTPKIFISAEQFDAMFKIRGLTTPITEVLEMDSIKRETRGRKRKDE